MMGAPGTTPGPWKVLPLEEGKPYVRVRGDALGWLFKIADVRMPPFADEAEVAVSVANARQIAASPKLYDACANAAEAFRHYEQLHSDKLAGALAGEPRVEIEAKVARNRELAEIMEAACAEARGEKLEHGT